MIKWNKLRKQIQPHTQTPYKWAHNSQFHFKIARVNELVLSCASMQIEHKIIALCYQLRKRQTNKLSRLMKYKLANKALVENRRRICNYTEIHEFNWFTSAVSHFWLNSIADTYIIELSTVNELTFALNHSTSHHVNVNKLYAAIYIYTLTKSLEINQDVNEKRMHTVLPMTLWNESNDLRAYRLLLRARRE